MKSDPVHLYFHSPCFDGIVSAAIACDYFEQVTGASYVELHPANYSLRADWLGTQLRQPAGVVDFLYHPAANFWADHHPTAFLTEEVRHDYEQRRGGNIFYDSSASSCAVLIWQRWGQSLRRTAPHYPELVEWADRIDSARYKNVQETLTFDSPALQIGLALSIYRGDAFSQHLVWLLRTHSLALVAARPEVRSAFEHGLELRRLGEERLRDTIHLWNGDIAVFDVEADGVLLNRYAPFLFYPDALYSAGIVRNGGQAKITVMRNPWREFLSAPLGDFCSRFGGGGHRRVGSILIDKNPTDALDQLLEMIVAYHRQAKAVAAA